jgi:hypothetical protein
VKVPKTASSGTPGLNANNVSFFRHSSGGGNPTGNVVIESGTLQMNDCGLRNGSQANNTDIALYIHQSSSLFDTDEYPRNSIGRVWAKNVIIDGPVQVAQTNAGNELVFSATESQIRYLDRSNTNGILDSTNGDIVLSNTTLLASPSLPGPVITSDDTRGTNAYSNISLYSPLHTIPASNSLGASGYLGFAQTMQGSSAVAAGLTLNNAGAGADLRLSASGATDIAIQGTGWAIYGDGTTTGTALLSDRNMKEHIVEVDPKKILEKVVGLSVTEWNYKTDPSRRYVGPMAQDFHAAFGLAGSKDTSISPVDMHGVTIAAIQGLNQKVDELQTRVVTLESALNVSRNVATGNLGIGMAIVGIPTLLIAAARRRKATKAD